MYSLFTVLRVVYAIVRLIKQADRHSIYFHKQGKVSLGKYMSDHLTFD